jgi:ABC-type transport system involved in multi-copper enzyme maturation permease subunit
MIALLRKDLRLNAPVTIALLLTYITLPFLVFGALVASDGLQHTLKESGVATSFVITAFVGLGISLFILPAFGGIAFARERRERSADFLAAHPIPRRSVVVSKLIVTLALCSLPWLLSVVIVVGVQRVLPRVDGSFVGPDGSEIREGVMWLLRLQAMLLGGSWLLSSLLRSETVATTSTILGTIVLAIAFATYRSALERTGYVELAHARADVLATILTLAIGLGGFLAGTLIAFKRTSP